GAVSLAGLPLALTRTPDGGARFQLMLATGAMSLLVAALAVIVWPRVRRYAPAVNVDAFPSLPFMFCVLTALVVMYVSVRGFTGWPQFPDSFAEYFQARLLTAGKLWAAAPQRADLFRIGNTVVDDGRWYAQ